MKESINLAMQGVAELACIEKHFSINDVIKTAFTAGTLSGAGLIGPGAPATAAEASAKAGSYALSSAVSSVSSQLVEMKIGTRPRFDFKAVASAVTSSYIGTKIGAVLPGQVRPDVVDEVEQVAANTALSTAINSAIYRQEPSIEMMAAQAVGTFIGQEAGGEINKGIEYLRAPRPQQHFNEPEQKSHVASQRQKTTNRNFEEKLQIKKLIAENKIPIMDEKINVNKIDELIQQQRDSRMSRWSGSAGITNAKLNNNAISQTSNILNKIANSTPVTFVNGLGDDFTSSVLQTITSMSERFSNLAWYGRFDTNEGEQNYINQLSNAYRTDHKQFINMLGNPNKNPVSGTISLFEGAISYGIGRYLQNDLLNMYKTTYSNDGYLYHTTTTTHDAMNVAKGINPKYLKNNTRFAGGFYTSEKPETTFAELLNKNAVPTDTIKFTLDEKIPKVLDLTNPATAKAWNYQGGEVTTLTQKLGIFAKDLGFNAVRVPSERAAGNNIVFLNEFNRLIPQEITPAENLFEEPLFDYSYILGRT